jgi:hypothetical protein
MCLFVTESPVPATGRSALRAAAGAERPVRCGGCGRAYELTGWLALTLVGTLTGDAIAAHVVKWPHGVRIEVRRCARCAGSIARTVES